MRPALILTAFIAMISCLGTCSVAHAECLPSAKAVWAEHPGSHATWRTRDEVKCWFVGFPAHRVRQRIPDFRRGAVHEEAHPQTDGRGPARSESQETSAPTGRDPPSILRWGTPMEIDATWEELFAKRERRAE
jgi:hypothetical protein